jgi:hypothetical protein
MAGTEGEVEGSGVRLESQEEIEDIPQHGIGARLQQRRLGVPGSNFTPEDTIRRIRLGAEDNPDLIDSRSIVSRSGRKRSDTLKPDTMKVFKFDGTDYEIWSKAMGFYLDGAGLWEVVTGSDRRPEDPDELEDWRLANTKACNVLFSALTRDQQKNVVNCDLAAEMWTTLSQIYARKSMINQAYLIQEYEDYHMKRGVTMMKYINDIRGLIGKLRGVGVVYPDKSIVLKVLRGLSEEYAVDRKILFKQENLTFEDVCGCLLSEEMMSNNSKKTRTPGPALANVSKGYNHPSEVGKVPRVKTCYICRQEGHLSPDCPHKSGVQGEKVYICFNCGQKGHKIADCPKEKPPLKSSKPGGSNLAVAEEKKPVK